MPRLLAFSWPHLNEDAQPVMSHYASSDRTFSRQPPTDPFAQPIIEGDARCVKIIGAAVGEQPPYATGIIISEDGMILTVGGALLAADRLRIVTADGHVHSGSVIRRTTSPDLALLKIDAPCKRYFDLADAVEPAQGQWVVALTHAFRIAEGDEPLSANAGIVCGWAEVDAQRRAQRVTVSGWLLDTIVSNPGSGGGAVIDRSGRLVGMVGRAMVARHTGTALNYMIGVDRLRTFVQGETAADTSADSRTDVVGELGIVLFTLAGRSAPAYVDHVRPGSPAHAAGVRPDDLVVAIDGQAIATIAQYEQVAATWRAGQSIALSVQRAERIISVTVRARPAEGSE
jgi:serine protease Do